MAKIPAEIRFWAKVDKQGPVPERRQDLGRCWNWLGYLINNGYGKFRHTTRQADPQVLAHRFAYELVVGKIPEGLEIDHLCRNRRCVNPSHLEPVTQRENMLRGDTNLARAGTLTHCPAGHPYDEKNTRKNAKGHRTCRECHRLTESRRRKARGAGEPRRHLLTWRGETRNLTAWAAHLGINPQTLVKRISSGWPTDKALSTPVRTAGRRLTPDAQS